MKAGSLVPVVTISLIVALIIAAPACAEKTHTITAGAGEGGRISPSGTVHVNHGDSQTFIVEPAAGYRIGNVVVDGRSLGPLSFYTFTNVREDHSISAAFISLTGALEVESSPAGASVFLDGIYLGTTTPSGPARFDRIEPGTHSLRLVLQGYEDYETGVTISEGVSTTIPLVTLVPIPTTIPTTSPTATQTTVPTTSPTATQTPFNATAPAETIPGDQGGVSAPRSPPWTLLVLATGLVATVILSRDLLSSHRDPSHPARYRALALVVLGIPCVVQAMALHAIIRSPGTGTGLFFELAVIAVPVCLYLVLSSFGLIIGALLSWPFRGMLKAHTVAGAIMVFLSIFSLARGDDPEPFLTALLLLSGLLAALGARWQEGQYAPAGGPGVPAQAGAEVPLDSEVTRALSPRGQGMFPAELADKYSSIEFVGSGGLAHVYRAINRNTGGEVALKIPLRSDETTGKSFMKEIRGWEGLYHPNIVRVNEANILPIPYIEMEYIRRTLADLPKPLPVREAARICRDLCRGLSYAHEHQVVHRDIKPHNIMVTDEGVPKISDWGMSKVMGVPGMPTVTGFSLAYAAPEQLAPGTFGETDRRTDIYQLGCVLYELLTGRSPSPAQTWPRCRQRSSPRCPRHLPK